MVTTVVPPAFAGVGDSFVVLGATRLPAAGIGAVDELCVVARGVWLCALRPQEIETSDEPMGVEAGTSTLQRSMTVTLTPSVVAVASPAGAARGAAVVDITTRSDEPYKLSVRTSKPATTQA